MSKRRAVETASFRPWQAAILAIDTATTSGWSVRVNDDQREFGECHTLDHDAVLRVVKWTVRCGERAGMPCVLVLEAPWGRNPKTIGALRAARERWELAWRMAGQRHVVTVMPAQWRAAVLGMHWARAKRDDVRREEKRIAEILLEQPVTADEAAAVHIGRWAARASLVGITIGAMNPLRVVRL